MKEKEKRAAGCVQWTLDCCETRLQVLWRVVYIECWIRHVFPLLYPHFGVVRDLHIPLLSRYCISQPATAAALVISEAQVVGPSFRSFLSFLSLGEKGLCSASSTAAATAPDGAPSCLFFWPTSLLIVSSFLFHTVVPDTGGPSTRKGHRNYGKN